MILRWLVASFHLLALAVGFGAIAIRARGLGRAREAHDLAAVFRADNWWGVAAVVWLFTGLWRAFGGLERGAAYYMQHPLFHAKLGLFVLIFVLELWPMVTLIKWRLAVARSEQVDLTRTGTFSRISYLQLALVTMMVLLASAIARGIGV